MSGSGSRDWSDLHALLDAMPAGKWTTYGDIAQVIGTSAQAIGNHLGACHQCTNAHRVLSAAGLVSPGFQWLDPDRTDIPQELLIADGVRFVDGAADGGARLRPPSLAELVRGRQNSSVTLPDWLS